MTPPEPLHLDADALHVYRERIAILCGELPATWAAHALALEDVRRFKREVLQAKP